MTNLPAVFLNHLVIVLDTATYRALEHGTFVREAFAVTEQRTTIINDCSHTALYLYGTTTYLELFSSATFHQHGGIALGVDEAGALHTLGDLAPAVVVESEPVSRAYGKGRVPWFYVGGQPDFPKGAALAVWLMAYHPRFLAEWHPQPGEPNQGVGRKEVLQRYRAVLQDRPPQPYFEDIVSFTVATDEVVRKRLLELVALLGYREQHVGDATVLNGPEIELRLIPQTDEVWGVREVTMRVTGRPEGGQAFRFGTTSLRFWGDGLATWSFSSRIAF